MSTWPKHEPNSQHSPCPGWWWVRPRRWHHSSCRTSPQGPGGWWWKPEPEIKPMQSPPQKHPTNQHPDQHHIIHTVSISLINIKSFTETSKRRPHRPPSSHTQNHPCIKQVDQLINTTLHTLSTMSSIWLSIPLFMKWASCTSSPQNHPHNKHPDQHFKSIKANFCMPTDEKMYSSVFFCTLCMRWITTSSHLLSSTTAPP